MQLCSGSTVRISAPPAPHLLIRCTCSSVEQTDSVFKLQTCALIVLCLMRVIPALVSRLPVIDPACSWPAFQACFPRLPACLLSTTTNFGFAFPFANSACSGLFYYARLPVTLPASASHYETADPCLPSVQWIKLFYFNQLCCIWFLPRILTSTTLCAVI